MLSRQKIGLVAVIGIYLLTMVAAGYIVLPSLMDSYRRETSEFQRLSASEFLDSISQLEIAGVEVTGLKIVGAPAVKKNGARDRWDYVLVGASDSGETLDTCLLVSRREKNDASLAESLAKGKLVRHFELDQFSDLDEETQNYLEENFPDVDFKKTALVSCNGFMPSWMNWVLYVGAVWQVFSIGYLIYLVFKKPKEQPWQGAIDDDRSDSYRKHQKAMRLTGSQFWSNGSLRERAIDLEFDVAEGKEVKHQKPKRALIWVLVFAAYMGATLFTHRLIRNSEWLADFDSFWLELAMIMPLAIGYAVISGMAKSRATGFGEEPIPIEKAVYRESEFHQFHDRVLNELEFIEVGDFRQISSPLVLTRTIYLNPNGNLLVEVGTQSGVPFFTLESLTNGGKFLETHSMVSQRTEMNNENKIHQRRAANHQDIVKALESHDQLVSDFTFAGSSHEAKFTPENFGRFLAFPSLKKLA